MCFRWMSWIGLVVGVSCTFVCSGKNGYQTSWKKKNPEQTCWACGRKKRLLLLLNFQFLFSMTMWWNGAGNRQHLFGIFRTICELFCEKGKNAYLDFGEASKKQKLHWQRETIGIREQQPKDITYQLNERFLLYLCVILRRNNKTFPQLLFKLETLLHWCFCYSFVQTVAISEGWREKENACKK